jgi:hypothetical protein
MNSVILFRFCFDFLQDPQAPCLNSLSVPPAGKKSRHSIIIGIIIAVLFPKPFIKIHENIPVTIVKTVAKAPGILSKTKYYGII